MGGRRVEKLSVPSSDEHESAGRGKCLERILSKERLLVSLPLTGMNLLEESDI